MSDILEELRIIGRDGGRLTPNDKSIIAQAADELETVQKQLIITQSQLIESQAMRIALNYRLLETDKQKPMNMAYGPFTLKVNQ